MDPDFSPYAPPGAMHPSGGVAEAPRELGPPSRGLAFLLSFISPGAGQFYAGLTRRWVFWLAFSTLGPLAAGVAMPLAVRVGLPRLGIGFVVLLTLGRALSAFDALRIDTTRSRRGAGIVAVAFVGSLAALIAGSLAERAFLLEAFKIPSGSMQPTVLVGDHLFVDKTAKDFRRGHLLVFAYPEHPEQDFVKRVVALGGDHVEVKDEHTWINGWEVPHCFVGHGKLPENEGQTPEGDLFVEFLDGEAYFTFTGSDGSALPTDGPWTVKDGEAFVLGDYRTAAHDSRFWYGGAGGGVPRGLVRGEPIVVWLSVPDGTIDWSRIGKDVQKPELPAAMASLRAGLEKCLASAPPLEATHPPKP
jgi:signal peptidase I